MSTWDDKPNDRDHAVAQRYKRMPPDIACRGCFDQWQDSDGSYWCCGKSATVLALEEFGALKGRIETLERAVHDLNPGLRILEE